MTGTLELLPQPGHGATPPVDLFPDLDVSVRPWPDPYLDSAGHDPRSTYVETYWLGILGPTALWFLRRVAGELEKEPEGYIFDASEWAGWLGLSCQTREPHTHVARTIHRCAAFGALRVPRGAGWTLPHLIECRTKLPTLTVSQVGRLPEDLRHSHRSAVERGEVRPVIAVMRERSRSLALSLVAMGEELAAIERQLTRWRFHPALARESAAWAWERRADSPGEPCADGAALEGGVRAL